MSLTALDLVQLQADLAGKIKSYSYFDDIPVLNDLKGDVVNLAAQSIARLGLAITISTPRFACRNGNTGSPVLDEIAVDVTVWEHVETNRAPGGTRKPALTVAQHALVALWQFTPDYCNVVTPMNPVIEEIGVEDPPGCAAYAVHLRTNGGYTATLEASAAGDNSLSLLGIQSSSTPTS